MRRNKSYDEILSKKLKNTRFAKSFILGLIEDDEGITVEDALKHTIRKLGTKEFAELSGIPSSNTTDFLTGKRKPKPETLDQYLKPFNLKIKITLDEAA